jgi:hypothetical protein
VLVFVPHGTVSFVSFFHFVILYFVVFSSVVHIKMDTYHAANWSDISYFSLEEEDERYNSMSY